jgi:hypothetical protein
MSDPAQWGNGFWELPPLILHPFADQSGPSKLLESSKASLMLQGLLPNDEFATDDLTRKLLEGRLSEIRMLYFVGKDVLRWTAQCLDSVSRVPDLASSGLREASFAAFLVTDTPPHVVEKLRTWGVSDYKSIFSRGIGLNAVFRQAPEGEFLSEDFVRNYYRFADHMFACWQNLTPFTEITSKNFKFDLYASGEYAKLLERQWDDSGGTSAS